jgi:hypothetical protein
MPIDIGAAATNAINKVKTVVDSTVTKGISTVTSALTGGNLLNAAANLQASVQGLQRAAESIVKVPIEVQGRLPNPLHFYSSFNYNFTLSVLDDASLNFPNETYRKGILGPILLKSANASPADRIPTIYKTPANPSGSFDFFIEDLSINHLIGFEKSTGNSNATGFNFKVVEPYSMGLFFQILQTAAKDAGHRNYLEVPLLLTVSFKGHIDANLQNVQIDNTTKYYPLRIRTIDMKVNGQGSVYDVNLYPINELAYSSSYSQLKTAASIKGETVIEMLQTGDSSLQKVLNDRLLEQVKRGSINVPDQILISFPIDIKTGDASTNVNTANSATVNPGGTASGDLFSRLKLTSNQEGINKTKVQIEGTVNHIGLSSMGFNLYQAGDTPFARDNLTYDAATGIYKRSNVNLEINPNQGEFRFGQGSDVINAINQVILMSDYGRTALTNISADGFAPWWRVETHVYYIPTDENLPKTGLKPKLIVYRVVPYDAHASAFSPPNTGTPGVEQNKAKVLKEYDYIYTGNNIDIIDFDIEFRAGFYTAIAADSGANNDSVVRTSQSSPAAETEDNKQNVTPTGNGNIKDGQVPTSQRHDAVTFSTANQGGGGLENAATIAARQFHDAITSGVDMIALTVTILGDPYYMGDSGMGNYSAVASDNRYINSDYSINYQSGEVHVLMNFRTPVDIDQSTGLFNFTSTAEVPQFSGLYKILSAVSKFNKGKFTQTLKMIRMPNQEVPATTAQTSVQPTAVLTEQARMLAEQEQGMFD